MTNKYCHTVSKRVVYPFPPPKAAGIFCSAEPARHREPVLSQARRAGLRLIYLRDSLTHAQEVTHGGYGHVQHEGEQERPRHEQQ